MITPSELCGDDEAAVDAVEEFELDAVGRFDRFGPKDVRGRSGFHHPTFTQEDEPVGEAGGEVEVVEGDDGGDLAFDRGGTDHRHDFELVLEVERAGGLVEEKDVRIAHERLGDRDHLLLAAGEIADICIRQMLDVEPGEKRFRRLDIIISDPPPMEMFSRDQNHVEDCECGRARSALRHVADAVRPFAPMTGGQIPAI